VTLRIALADDHPVFLEGLRMLVDSVPDLQVVGAVTDGSAVLRLLEDTAVDVLVLDVDMPGMDGITATEEVGRRWPELPVLLLTMHGEGSVIERGLKAGARGYVLKGASHGSIEQSIRAVANGETVLSGEVGRTVVAALGATGSLRSSVDGVALSGRDLEVLRLVARGCTNGEVAGQLHLSVKTVQNYVSSLLTRTGVSSRAALVAWARDRAGL
jgi:DNA-binding NarL/FixJ family response regulator